MIEYRKEIDGLRAIAVLPVVLFHAGFGAFDGGYVGVDVFFVISGYLITSIILSEKKAGTFSLVSFYERRARRILPALFLVMAVSIPAAWLWLLPKDMRDFSQSLVAVSLFSSNILFWHESGYFDTAAELKPLLHTWSLAVEEQYYVLFPLFLLLAWRLRRRRLVALLAATALISLGIAQWGAYNTPAAAFFLLHTRFWELAIGALVALWLAQQRGFDLDQRACQLFSIAGLSLIAYAVFTYDKATPFPSLFSLAPTLGTALVIIFATPTTAAGRLLGSRVLVAAGLISYSAYLWHQPIFAFARQRNVTDLGGSYAIALIFASFTAAYLSWRYVERPFRDRGRFSRSTIFATAAVVSLMLCLFGLWGHLTVGFPGRLGAELKRVLAVAQEELPFLECQAGRRTWISPDDGCVLGSEQNPRVVLIGDSHAASISRALEEWLEPQGIGFKFLTYAGCPLVMGLYRVDSREDNKCPHYSDAAYEHVKNSPSYEYVLLLARWPLYLEGTPFDNAEGGIELKVEGASVDVFENGSRQVSEKSARKQRIAEKYIETIGKYLQLGRKVVLIYSLPEPGWNVPRMISRKLMAGELRPQDGSIASQLYRQRNLSTHAAFDSLPDHDNLIRVKPGSIFCDRIVRDRCVVHVDGVPLYLDDDHLSTFGARMVVDEIAAKVRLK